MDFEMREDAAKRRLSQGWVDPKPQSTPALLTVRVNRRSDQTLRPKIQSIGARYQVKSRQNDEDGVRYDFHDDPKRDD